MMGLGTDPDVEKLVRIAKKAGCEVIVSGSNHLKWYSPLDADGKRKLLTTSSLTFKDKRRINRIRKALRTINIDV